MKSSMIARIAESSASGKEALQRLSRPKGTEFVTNGRGQVLHVRTSAAVAVPKGAIVYLHGLHAHCSRVHMEVYADELNKLGFHYAALDFHGHGYSQGERGVIASHEDLVDDAASLLTALYRDGNVVSDSAKLRIHCPPLDPSSCPFYFMGSSMGGGVSLLLAHMCFSRADHVQADRYAAACRGCILAAPAIAIKLPWFAPRFVIGSLQTVMSWTVLPLLPSLALPGAPLTSPCAATHPVWDTDEYVAYVEADAATHHGQLYFKTLFSVLELANHAQNVIHQLTHERMRVIAFMDPDDTVTDIYGVRMLQSAAPIAAAGLVSVVDMPRAKHDVLTNRMDDVWRHISAWLASTTVA